MTLKNPFAVALIALGIVLAFAALWCGAYFMHLFEFNDWQSFPTLMTAFAVFGGGMALIGLGAMKLSE